MAMHNPPHPGEFISEVYLEPNGLSGRELAAKLGVAPSTSNRLKAAGVSRGFDAHHPHILVAAPAGATIRPTIIVAQNPKDSAATSRTLTHSARKS